LALKGVLGPSERGKVENEVVVLRPCRYWCEVDGDVKMYVLHRIHTFGVHLLVVEMVIILCNTGRKISALVFFCSTPELFRELDGQIEGDDRQGCEDGIYSIASH